MRKAANHAAYPPEFRAEAVRLARTSGNPSVKLPGIWV